MNFTKQGPQKLTLKHEDRLTAPSLGTKLVAL